MMKRSSTAAAAATPPASTACDTPLELALSPEGHAMQMAV